MENITDTITGTFSGNTGFFGGFIKLLSLVGWQGIGIDANPALENDWLSARPRDKFINCCISSSEDSNKDL